MPVTEITNTQGLRMRSDNVNNFPGGLTFDWSRENQTTAEVTNTSEMATGATDADDPTVGVYKGTYPTGVYAHIRTVMDFDLSSLPSSPSINSVKLKLYGNTYGGVFASGNTFCPYPSTYASRGYAGCGPNTSGCSSGAGSIIVIKSTIDASVAADSYNDFTGYQDEWGASTVTEYSSEISSWSEGSYNEITLNSDAISEITSNAGGSTKFKVMIMNYDHDYVDSNGWGSGGLGVDMSVTSYGGTSYPCSVYEQTYGVNFNFLAATSNPPKLVVDYAAAADPVTSLIITGGDITMIGGTIKIT
tara:strand:+ start:1167 stop:2075 length:909 start_codon:yes stop_codon:yes gene_type:complete